ncbi:hypothetical protein [Pseudomonas sp. PvP001]|uniref:hypothetical protein n=1 Tax=Pseudomonas sp. PvP001 TaxID=3158559 RepID=UPI0033987C41
MSTNAPSGVLPTHAREMARSFSGRGIGARITSESVYDEASSIFSCGAYKHEGKVMGSVVSLTWRYSPADIVSEELALDIEGHRLTVAEGLATLEIDGGTFDQDPTIQARAVDSFKSILNGFEIYYRNPVVISIPQMVRKHADGHQTHYVELEPANITVSVSCSVKIIDQCGNVIVDDEVERKKFERQRVAIISSQAQSLGYKLAKHPADVLLVRLVDSYKNSISNPNNELVYLYEIRDALANRFGGEKGACSILGLPRGAWGRFGLLCNQSPIYQSRHRGKKYSESDMRHASTTELQEARDFALSMIYGYMSYLDALSES